MADKLGAMDFLKVYPSAGNFLYVEVTRGDAATLTRQLAERGVAVRYFAGPPRIANSLRITVGKPEHTDALVSALEEIRPA